MARRLQITLPQTIRFEHLGYKLRVRYPKGGELSNTRLPAGHVSGAFCRFQDSYTCEMVLAPSCPPSLVVHEIIHVLQHILKVKGAVFECEEESTAYMAQYIFDRIHGIRWPINRQ